MKKHKVIFRILLIVICCMCFTVTGYARAGGGGSSGGSGGGSGSSSGSGSHSHYYRQGGRRGGPVEMIIWWGTFICMAGAGTIVFHYGKIPEQKSYSKLEFETGLDGSKS